MIKKHPVEIAADILGSQAVLAAELNVKPSALSQWKLDKDSNGHKRRVPAEFCPSIERLTGGKVKCEDMRPDIEWWVLRKPAKAKPAKTARA